MTKIQLAKDNQSPGIGRRFYFSYLVWIMGGAVFLGFAVFISIGQSNAATEARAVAWPIGHADKKIAEKYDRVNHSLLKAASDFEPSSHHAVKASY